VPDLSVPITRITLLDASGTPVVDEAVPAEQQTRFTLEPTNVLGLVNRVRVTLAQTGPLGGDLARVQSVALERDGLASLENFAPPVRKELRWVVSALRLRKGCKGAWQ